jgi:MoaA/NifB/PqqE/SkfB family radical SAM enzyme
MQMDREINPRNYYRLPWSLTDNALSWLEVTTKCNLACEGCYRDSSKDGHKSLEDIAKDLAVFKKERLSDCISIAGGDPLVHPQIVEIVRMIKAGGWKPILNTNGIALTPELLHDLKLAGVFGFTFHIDTSQKRKDAPYALCEADLNPVRQKFAEMLAEEGNIACAFNQTVTSETLQEIPEVVRWAQKYPEIVHSVVFILYREDRLLGDFDYYANGKKIELNAMYKKSSWSGDKALKTPDVIRMIRETDPLFEPSAYLNGTVDPTSMKWTISVRVGTKDETFGYVTPAFMEKIQTLYRLRFKRWLSYSSPKFMRLGRMGALVSSLAGKGMRRITKNYLKTAFRKPRLLKDGAYFQAFGIIQPVDIVEDGRINMCDGCPDITVHDGKLYWSCRLEEVKEHGSFITAVPRSKSAQVGVQPEKIKEPPNYNA